MSPALPMRRLGRARLPPSRDGRGFPPARWDPRPPDVPFAKLDSILPGSLVPSEVFLARRESVRGWFAPAGRARRRRPPVGRQSARDVRYTRKGAGAGPGRPRRITEVRDHDRRPEPAADVVRRRDPPTVRAGVGPLGRSLDPDVADRQLHAPGAVRRRRIALARHARRAGGRAWSGPSPDGRQPLQPRPGVLRAGPARRGRGALPAVVVDQRGSLGHEHLVIATIESRLATLALERGAGTTTPRSGSSAHWRSPRRRSGPTASRRATPGRISAGSTWRRPGPTPPSPTSAGRWRATSRPWG